jgi:hypothetical protein
MRLRSVREFNDLRRIVNPEAILQLGAGCPVSMGRGRKMKALA